LKIPQGVIRSRKWKDKYNSQKEGQRTIYKTLHAKQKIVQHELSSWWGLSWSWS